MNHRIRFSTARTFDERVNARLTLSFSGSAAYPIPQFPPICVCCSSRDDLEEIRSPVMCVGQNATAQDLRVYACPLCKAHAVVSPLTEVGFWLVIIAVAFGVLTAIYGHWTWAAGLGIFAVVAALWVFRHAYMHPETRFGPGHGGPIRLAASPGSLEVATGNDKLAQALRELNADLL